MLAPLGTPATVTRALRLISEGALDREPLEEFAERLGVGGRHLRRLFDAHLGVPPRAVAQTQRLHFSRQLIESTDLPMTEIAMASGFASVRRFNGAVRASFGATPTDIRKRADRTHREREPGVVSLRLPFRPPYDWEAMLGFLAPRAIPGVEHVEGGVYARTISDRAWIAVRLDGERHLRLDVHTSGTPAGELFAVVGRVRRLFDLDCDPAPIAAVLGKDRILSASVRARPGLRVPGAWDALEIGVRAVLGQQVTVAGATTLARRLVERFGARVETTHERLTHLFPTARALARGEVSAIGIPPVRGEAIRELARLDGAELEDESALIGIKGIGPWTAAYVTMRAARDPDALPATDLAVRKAIGLEREKEIEERAEAWRPWRAYAVMHLWSKKKEKER
jgi:AraC family transcriptional regulator of adaptative response / DNA-3-methyladenine glycosylase II